MHIRPFQAADESAVVALWEECRLTRPWNDPHKDIVRKLAVQPELFLVGVVEGAVIASVMAGYEGHRGWVNYLAVAPENQRGGLARQMMSEAERRDKAVLPPDPQEFERRRLKMYLFDELPAGDFPT